MPHYLLTGAGFSRNWGGWLATEAFEYLLGCKGLHPRVRTLLWQHKDKGGFEAVYQTLKDQANNPMDQQVFRGFHMMVTGMFHTMGQRYEQALIGTNILNFLVSFDAIFTLNQDTLLEQKYPEADKIRQSSGGTFLGYELPGLRTAKEGEFMPAGFLTPTPPPYALTRRMQPYFKLHGSSNWVQPSAPDLMLIIGGNKPAEIAKQPLLQWYHQQFQTMITGSRLFIIGYSFNDDHINAHLCRAATQGTRLFIIDPSGVDIIDKRIKGPGMIPIPPTPLMEALMNSIDGASRRDLTRTFSGDNIEFAKIDRFMQRFQD